MTTLTKLLPADARPAQILLKRAKRIALASAARAALPHHLDAAGEHLHHTLEGHRPLEIGDVLLDERGGFWVIGAAPEKLLRVSGSPDTLLRAAWALGDAHVRIAVSGGGFDILPDAGLRGRLEAQGLVVSEVEAPFAPETGAAFAEPTPVHVHGPGCGHDHGHDHDHAHGHDHEHDHDHGAHDHAHAHAHDHDDGHDHAHAHGEHAHDHDHPHGHEHAHGHDHGQEHPHGRAHDHDDDHAHGQAHDHGHPRGR